MSATGCASAAFINDAALKATRKRDDKCQKKGKKKKNLAKSKNRVLKTERAINEK